MRRPPRSTKSRGLLSPTAEEPNTTSVRTSPTTFARAEKGKGKDREEPETPKEDVDRSTKARVEFEDTGFGPVASTSKAIFASSSLTPLNETPLPHPAAQRALKGPALSQLFDDGDESETPRRPGSLYTSSRSRKRQTRIYNSDSATTDYDTLAMTGSRKRRKLKKLKSAKARTRFWTPVMEAFGSRIGEENEGSSDGDEPVGSIERFRKNVVPLSTIRERQQRERGEDPNGKEQEGASEYDIGPPKKAFKRVSTFLGGNELDHMTKENRKELLRKAPYRTVTTDAEKLEFVSASEAGLGRSFDKTVPRRKRKPTEVDQVEKIQRLRPGKTPRTPFLGSISQTEFAPVAREPDTQRLRPLTNRIVSDSEVARLSKQGSGWVSTKRGIGANRPKPKSTKKALTMIEEEEARDVMRRDRRRATSSHSLRTVRDTESESLSFRPETRKTKKARKPVIQASSTKFKFRSLPFRAPPPVRPFAHLAPPKLVPEARFTESIQTASATNSRQLPPTLSGPFARFREAEPPRLKQTTFRFITGPKAKRAPTILVQDTPVQQPPALRPQRKLTISASLPNLDNLSRMQTDSPLARPLAQVNPKQTEEGPPENILMRRLSTLPVHHFGSAELREMAGAALDRDNLVVEPNPSHARYPHSSHSNRRQSGVAPEPLPPALPALPALPPLATPSVLSTLSLPPGYQHTTTLPLSNSNSTSPAPEGDDFSRSLSPSSFERAVLAVFDDAARSQMSNELEQPVDYLATLRSNSEQPASTTGPWWMSGPTYSAALGGAAKEFDLAALRGFASSETMSSSGAKVWNRTGTTSDDEDVGEETEVHHSSPAPTLVGNFREQEEPPESLLRGLEGA
ncbi:hypothetical protein JCM16303_004749 [Sporobolomyces ruberrimus]